MKKDKIVTQLKFFGLPKKYIMKRPKRVLALQMRRFRLFMKGNDIIKGNRYA